EPGPLSLNAVILANVNINTVSLDSQTPFVRVGDVDGKVSSNSKFMYVLKPNPAQTNADEKVRVRRVPASAAGVSRGTFIMLKNPFSSAGLRLEYLTTSGAAVNPHLNMRSIFVTSAGLSQSGYELIGSPAPGMDQSDVTVEPETRIQYSIQTGNRLVTPSDVRIFCRKELLSRYGISGELVRSVSVGNRLQEKFEVDGNASGYAIAVDIRIADTGFVRRSFADRVPEAEMILEKMIEVRSTAVYPVKVSIKIVQ
ncbi:MAG: hypothetical protein MJY56_07275, partial [Bacteroidales bacterium]|nr:hypothetical protein [Bacteroidales bacterium]